MLPGGGGRNPLVHVTPPSWETDNPEKNRCVKNREFPIWTTGAEAELLYPTRICWPAVATEVSLCVDSSKGRVPGNVRMWSSAGSLICTSSKSGAWGLSPLLTLRAWPGGVKVLPEAMELRIALA